MKSWVSFWMAGILSAAVLIWPFTVQAAPPSVSTNAETAALIDVTSGRILYSKQGDKPMRIASLTKIMTAIVAIEHGNLSDKVRVSKNAFGKEGSSIYLKLDEEMSLNNLLYGMMLRSGNDAATAIAEHVGGTVEGFAYMMNEKARMIGMERTTFKNPHGLDADGHLSTANDMAKLAAYALHNPVFQEIVKTKVKKAPNPNDPWDYTWLNKNKMLNMYDGADGVKTGYTKTAKRCLVSSATRNGQQLAVVTLNDGDDWADHAKLLDYGFQNYPLQKVIGKGDPVEGTEYVAGTTFMYPVLDSEKGQFTSKVQLNAANSINNRLGEAGKLQLSLSGKPIGSIPVYTKGSPRLKLPERPAFTFNQSDKPVVGFADKWLYTIQFLVRVLFTGRSV
ncbi:D-alanyl-D-alanine carboxypeptidase family protein [Paenibacillus sp. NPDC056579]|uniref:D-alanyl-D-alanine carboxypeptidase family protein n=1 Tax=Paenibacillus sp. NPDC056579 TaxID=3345871 RepID=UPI0036B22B9E